MASSLVDEQQQNILLNVNEAKATTTISFKNLFNIDFAFICKTSFQRGTEKLNVKIYSLRLNYLLKDSYKGLRCLLKKDLKLMRLRDLIHSISALYDTCLPDMGATSVYDCITAPKAHTICILKDDDGENYEKLNENYSDDEEKYEATDCLETVENSLNQPDGIFHDIFSDLEAESSGESSCEDNENDFTIGVDTFIKQNSKHSSSRLKLLNNLIGCATLQKILTFQPPGQDENVIDLQLMCVRKRFRGYNIGKFLLTTIIQNRNYVGTFDAIVTSSDLMAIEFYEKFGFNSDSILNSKYSFIGDIWTNTTKMCFIPPYSLIVDLKNRNQTIEQYVMQLEEYLSRLPNKTNEVVDDKYVNLDDLEKNSFIGELTNMEKDFKRWQKLMFSSYQYQSQLFNKLKQEIITLKAKLCAKDNLIDDLRIQNSLLISKNKFLNCKLNELLIDDIKISKIKDIDTEDDQNEIDKLISQLEIISNNQNKNE